MYHYNYLNNKMVTMCYQVSFKTEEEKTYNLNLLHAVEIEKSVEKLAATCTITLPLFRYNNPLFVHEDIKRGTEVTVCLGYDNQLEEEFRGYVTKIVYNNSSIVIECEDALFLFRKSLQNEQLQEITLKDLLIHISKQIDPTYTIDCDYEFTYETYTLNNKTGYDILKEIQDNLTANVWFNTKEKMLHVHLLYTDKLGKVKYSAHQNIESSTLEYTTGEDRKVEVIVEIMEANGKAKQIKVGEHGGEQFSLKIGNAKGKDIQKLAKSIYEKKKADRLNGSLTSWLVPFVSPGFTVEIIDQEYPERRGSYYVASVKTSFSDAGGVRTIEPGIKLG
ncbi:MULTISPECIES: hypothetical protein [unclassified Myroides]|uniref:hypothetical protein n=1 Tax=unclassified Myroides TaxID=2642485 RepID=UPI0025759A9F|nr:MULTISPECIES: hypothetical protein [unclassified Myroides]